MGMEMARATACIVLMGSLVAGKSGRGENMREGKQAARVFCAVVQSNASAHENCKIASHRNFLSRSLSMSRRCCRWTFRGIDKGPDVFRVNETCSFIARSRIFTDITCHLRRVQMKSTRVKHCNLPCLAAGVATCPVSSECLVATLAELQTPVA